MQQATLQVFVCRSGSAADTQAITAYVQYYLHQHQMELNDEILVKTAASFATKMVYSNKASSNVLHEKACSASLQLLRGFHPRHYGPCICACESCKGGMRLDRRISYCCCRRCCKQASLWQDTTLERAARCMGCPWEAPW